nr:Ras GTPase-activating protein-binding protein 2-like isoform X1 [Tanacetum cinerariifolium]
TVAELETEFKKLGPVIKQGGVQVRSNKQLEYCFGFTEFQDLSSMQNAIQDTLSLLTWRLVPSEKVSSFIIDYSNDETYCIKILV